MLLALKDALFGELRSRLLEPWHHADWPKSNIERVPSRNESDMFQESAIQGKH